MENGELKETYQQWRGFADRLPLTVLIPTVESENDMQAESLACRFRGWAVTPWYVPPTRSRLTR